MSSTNVFNRLDEIFELLIDPAFNRYDDILEEIQQIETIHTNGTHQQYSEQGEDEFRRCEELLLDLRIEDELLETQTNQFLETYLGSSITDDDARRVQLDTIQDTILPPPASISVSATSSEASLAQVNRNSGIPVRSRSATPISSSTSTASKTFGVAPSKKSAAEIQTAMSRNAPSRSPFSSSTRKFPPPPPSSSPKAFTSNLTAPQIGTPKVSPVGSARVASALHAPRSPFATTQRSPVPPVGRNLGLSPSSQNVKANYDTPTPVHSALHSPNIEPAYASADIVSPIPNISEGQVSHSKAFESSHVDDHKSASPAPAAQPSSTSKNPVSSRLPLSSRTAPALSPVMSSSPKSPFATKSSFVRPAPNTMTQSQDRLIHKTPTQTPSSAVRTPATLSKSTPAFKTPATGPRSTLSTPASSAYVTPPLRSSTSSLRGSLSGSASALSSNPSSRTPLLNRGTPLRNTAFSASSSKPEPPKTAATAISKPTLGSKLPTRSSSAPSIASRGLGLVKPSSISSTVSAARARPTWSLAEVEGTPHQAPAAGVTNRTDEADDAHHVVASGSSNEAKIIPEEVEAIAASTATAPRELEPIEVPEVPLPLSSPAIPAMSGSIPEGAKAILDRNQDQLWTIFISYLSPNSPTYAQTSQRKNLDLHALSAEDAWNLLRDFDVCPTMCSKLRICSLIQEINATTTTDAATAPTITPERVFQHPARSPLGAAPQFGSRIPVLVALESSPVRIIRKQNAVGRSPPANSRFGMPNDSSATNQTKPLNDLLSYNGFIKLLFRIVYSNPFNEDLSLSLNPDAQRIIKLLFRMESSNGRSKMRSKGNRSVKTLGVFALHGDVPQGNDSHADEVEEEYLHV